jgi:isoquinoline 1-oxidoreductase subunit beta
MKPSISASGRGAAPDREDAMNFVPKMNRRSFVVGTATMGGGLALGLHLPFGATVVRAADGSPEVTAWVVIRPDDSVVIRIARSEMGQGSLTGLAQLVAEELECNWSKVSTEFPTPGESLARKRVYGDMYTGGSRGVRSSQQYLREAGAAARVMLIEAAAKEWNVPVRECSAADSVITHGPSGRRTTYGKVAEAAAKFEPPKEVKLKHPKTGRSPARASSASTPPISSPASKSAASTLSCRACSPPQSGIARFGPAR